MKQLTRRYKYEIHPSPVQKKQLARIFGSVRFIYNEFLSANENMWNDEDKINRLSRCEMQELLPVWKEAFPFLSDCPSQSLQVATHDLDVAYQNFFQGRSDRPKKKKLSQTQSFSIPQPKIQEVSGQRCIFIPNYKTWVPIRMHRDFPSQAKLGSATIKKTPSGRYFISVVCIFVTNEAIESKASDKVGIDLNIHHMVLSHGEKIETPKIISTLESRKRRLQKKMQRQRDQQDKEKRTERSRNYEKTRLQLAQLHERIKNQKEDFLHKLGLKIYRENQSVVMETLNVKGMIKNRRLAKSISFQSWGRFTEIMKTYAVQYDKQLQFIDRWFPSSKMCHDCGYVNQDLTLSDRVWICESCGISHDRDINAAINIKNEGGSYPVYKPVERKGSVTRPRRQTTMPSVKQESSRFEATHESA